MSIDTALQRVAELNALTGQAPAASAAGATAAGSTAFPAVLAAAQSPDGSSANASATGGSFAPRLNAAYAASGSAAGAAYGAGLPTGGSYSGGGSLTGVQVGLSPTSPGSGLPVLVGPGGAVGTMPGSNVGQAMVALAQREVGVSEQPPGSNDAPRLRDYRSATAGAVDRPGPWCAYFVSWLARSAGAPIGNAGNGVGYVPALEQWARSSGRWTDGAGAPGDLVVFDHSGSRGLPDHVGIVEGVDPDGTVHTIEGNSSNQVARRTYAPGNAQIKGFVRVG